MEALGPVEPRRVADRSLVLIVVAGTLIRIANWAVRVGGDLGFNDSLYYSSQAAGLVRGRVFRELFSDLPGAEHGPLTAVLMAPFSWGAEPHRWQRLVTVAAGSVTVWVVGRLAWRLGGRRAGLVAAALVAVSPACWMPSGLVMSEAISMLLVSLTMWALVEWGPLPTTRARVAGIGALLGLGALARSELALTAVLVVAAMVVANRRQRRRAVRPLALVVTTAALVVAPWVAFNLARFERPVLLTVNEGTTLQGANCDDTYHGGDTGGWSIFCADASPYLEPSVRTTADRERAWSYVRSHLDDVPRVVAARLARTLDLYGLEDMLHQDVGEERPAWAARAGVPVFWVTAIAAAWALARRRLRGRWPTAVVLMPIVTVLVTTVVFYGSHRIRSSAEPSLAVLAALTIAAWPTGRRRATRVVAACVSVAVVSAAVGPGRLGSLVTDGRSSDVEDALLTGSGLVPATQSPATGAASATPMTSSSTTVPPVEPMLSLPTAPSRPVRVLVVGDSTAYYLGEALRSWSTQHPQHVATEMVWCNGCGFILDGEITSYDGSPFLATAQQRFEAELPDLVETFEPDLVVLMVTVADIADREWDPVEGTLTPRDPRYVERMRRAYTQIGDRLTLGGVRRVVWVVPPVPATYFPTADLGESDRYEVQHDVIRAVAAAAGNDAAVLCDLDRWFRSARADADTWWRPDGTHLTDESALRLVDDWWAPWLVRTALGLPTDGT